MQIKDKFRTWCHEHKTTLACPCHPYSLSSLILRVLPTPTSNPFPFLCPTSSAGMWGNSPTSSTSAFASRLRAEMGQSASSRREQLFQKSKQNMALKGQQEGLANPVPGDRWTTCPTRTWAVQLRAARPSLGKLLAPRVKQPQCVLSGSEDQRGGSEQEGREWARPRSGEVQGYGREVWLASQWAEGPLPVRLLSSCFTYSPKLHPPLSKERLQATRATYLYWNLNWLKWNKVQNSVTVATF